MLNLKKMEGHRWDLTALGEVMLRFDPGEDRIQTARSFRVFEGGGEYNVARTLAHCFRKRTTVVTALADNPVGRLVEALISEGGVDTSNILWRDADGISGNVRNGLNFVERGFGSRSPVGCSDRANTAISRLGPHDIDWAAFFESNSTRWFHTGGIFAALSDSTARIAADAMRAARKIGAIVSYDLNYRESLWQERGGREAANTLNSALLDEADVVFGIEGFDARLDSFSALEFEAAAKAMLDRHSTLKVAATSLRDVIDASEHNVGGAIFANGVVSIARGFRGVKVLDRVGSGDAFASGIIYGALEGLAPERSVEVAVANSVLAMASPGDASTATVADIDRLIGIGSAEIKR
ncbi:MAG: sugar kinase [Acidobacteria bacterium]|nr:sugar kinase [Acidobacteriota bacterium]